MEEKIKNIKIKLRQIEQEIDEAPGWGAYLGELLEKQRNLLRLLTFYEKESIRLKKEAS